MSMVVAMHLLYSASASHILLRSKQLENSNLIRPDDRIYELLK